MAGTPEHLAALRARGAQEEHEPGPHKTGTALAAGQKMVAQMRTEMGPRQGTERGRFLRTAFSATGGGVKERD